MSRPKDCLVHFNRTMAIAKNTGKSEKKFIFWNVQEDVRRVRA